MLFFEGGSYRYWRYTLNDATGGNSYISAGRLWLGDYFDFDPASLENFRVTKVRSDTVTYGRGRQKYATEGVGWRRFSMAFPRTSEGGSTLTNVQSLIDTNGRHSSWIFSNFNVRRDYPLVEPVYVSFDDDVTFSHTTRQRYTYTMSFTEDR